MRFGSRGCHLDTIFFSLSWVHPGELSSLRSTYTPRGVPSPGCTVPRQDRRGSQEQPNSCYGARGREPAWCWDSPELDLPAPAPPPRPWECLAQK